jgi:hypothetical protein
VAAASTYSQRGVMTAVPKDRSLGLTRCMRTWGARYSTLRVSFFGYPYYGSSPG